MSEEPERCILDASAVLAYLHREPGGDTVALFLDSGLISAVNLSEVAARIVEKGASPAQAVALVEDLGLEVVPVDRPCAYEAAWLRGATRPLGLSLADRICLATAKQHGLPAVTMDRSWADLQIGVQINVLR